MGWTHHLVLVLSPIGQGVLLAMRVAAVCEPVINLLIYGFDAFRQVLNSVSSERLHCILRSVLELDALLTEQHLITVRWLELLEL